MTNHSETQPRPQSWLVPMLPRDPNEAHRAATPLELFFDLVFVVAVAIAASNLHHGIAEDHAAEAILGYVMIFFGIWWAWMNFTWFASAYDVDDVPYRLAVFVQITGALILAAGVNQVFEGDLTIGVLGYVVMRLAIVGQWIRAARSDTEQSLSAYRMAGGISLCQTGWVVLLFLPETWLLYGFVILALAELLVPMWGTQAKQAFWHADHISERYGLFTIIVLGESILASSIAIQSALEAGELNFSLITIIGGALLIVYSMWWLYFDQPAHDLLTSISTAFFWGYGHLIIFGSTAAVGAGIGVAVDYVTHHAEVGAIGAGLSVALPVAIYLLCLWALHAWFQKRSLKEILLFPGVSVLILLTPFTGQAVLLTGLLLAGLMAYLIVTREQWLRETADEASQQVS